VTSKETAAIGPEGLTHDSAADSGATVTTDVVVLGAGPAGMAAVAAAAGTGAEVLSVEATGYIGGNSVWSTGYLAFVGSAMQAEEGIVDDVEVFVRDARRMVVAAEKDFGVSWDEDLVRLFARESAETYRILTERGVRFSRFIPRPQQHTIDRMAAVEDSWMFQRAFDSDYRRPNVTALFGTTATRLVTDGTGGVTGVHLKATDGTVRQVEVRSGVVLATGGYQANALLRQRYQPNYLADAPYLGIDTCRGDGHLMGQAVGGDLVNMTYVPPLVIVSSSLVEDAIAVNEQGQRFHDEAGPYEDRVRLLLEQPNRRGWYVFDDVVAAEKAQVITQMPQPAVSADSLAELARAISVPPAALEESVERWNTFLRGGGSRDQSFGRVVLPPGRRRLQVAPFTAVPMVVGINFCSGGFRVTNDMQVIDVFGSPIRGLYAAGDCVGGLNPISDLGGIHLSGAFTLGRLAGSAAAQGKTDNQIRLSVQGSFIPSMVDTTLALVNIPAGDA
jgi:fumarate reductase flavoprotein subunit